MNDIINKIKSMDKKELNLAMEKAKEFAKTPQGKELMQQLKDGNGTSQQKERMNELKKDESIAKLIFDILNGKG